MTKMIEQLVKHMALYGYEPLELQTVSDANTFLMRAGDSIMSKLFTFPHEGKQLTLRPEFTALAASHYNELHLKGEQRWQCKGPVFEENRNSPSHVYEKESVGAEYFGNASVLAEAEIISMAFEGLKKLNSQQNYKLVIGHVGLLWKLLSTLNLSKHVLRSLILNRNLIEDENRFEDIKRDLRNNFIGEVFNSKLDSVPSKEVTENLITNMLQSTHRIQTMGGRNASDITQRVLDNYEQSSQIDQIDYAIDIIKRWMSIEDSVDEAFLLLREIIPDHHSTALQELDHLRQLVALLENYNIYPESITIKADLTQNWDYYTGIVFGIQIEDTWLVSGGRYDDLTHGFDQSKIVPAVGFAYRMDAISKYCDTEETISDLFTLLYTESLSAYAIEWAQKLRSAGIKIRLDNVKGTKQDLEIKEDGSILFGNESFSSKQFDLLITKLRTLLS
ncbi:ATP phosphoribosyltransferase regulatory subunit [Anaerolineales bacterium]